MALASCGPRFGGGHKPSRGGSNSHLGRRTYNFRKRLDFQQESVKGPSTRPHGLITSSKIPLYQGISSRALQVIRPPRDIGLPLMAAAASVSTSDDGVPDPVLPSRAHSNKTLPGADTGFLPGVGAQ